MVKSTGCACRGHMFSSQDAHGGSQLSITPVPGYQMASSGLCRQQVLKWYAYTHDSKTSIYIYIFKIRHSIVLVLFSKGENKEMFSLKLRCKVTILWEEAVVRPLKSPIYLPVFSNMIGE